MQSLINSLAQGPPPTVSGHFAESMRQYSMGMVSTSAPPRTEPAPVPVTKLLTFKSFSDNFFNLLPRIAIIFEQVGTPTVAPQSQYTQRIIAGPCHFPKSKYGSSRSETRSPGRDAGRDGLYRQKSANPPIPLLGRVFGVNMDSGKNTVTGI